MSTDLDNARDVVKHLVDAVTAHGLVEIDSPAVAKSLAWLRQVLPVRDQGLLAAARRDPGAGPVREALARSIHAMLKDNPGLLAELRSLLGSEVGIGRETGEGT